MNGREAYRRAARMEKAYILADVLTVYVKAIQEPDDADTVADVVETLSDHTWELVAEKARVNPPSEETKQMVLSILRQREELIEDLFEKDIPFEQMGGGVKLSDRIPVRDCVVDLDGHDYKLEEVDS